VFGAWFWSVTDVVKRIVLLPGLDGTGRLFDELIRVLPREVHAITASYPPDRFLPYRELQVMVGALLPVNEPYVLLGESYSAPLAVQIAGAKPRNLAGLILSSGFVNRPVGQWTLLAEAAAQPWILRLDPPRLIAKYFAIGMDAPDPVVENAVRVWRSVRPEVLSARAREAMQCDASSDLVRCTVPLLYLQGTQDHLLAESSVREITRVRPDVVFAKTAAPHMLLQRVPQWGANVIATFLDRLQI
jgi:pimeloyl-ACP methyl ester carboxylesterase